VCSDAAGHALVFNGSNGILARSVRDWVDTFGYTSNHPRSAKQRTSCFGIAAKGGRHPPQL
jgi:hypothetical protein